MWPGVSVQAGSRERTRAFSARRLNAAIIATRTVPTIRTRSLLRSIIRRAMSAAFEQFIDLDGHPHAAEQVAIGHDERVDLAVDGGGWTAFR